MRAVVLMFGTLSWDTLSLAEQTTYYEQHRVFVRTVTARPGCRLLAGEALQAGDSATVIRFPGDHQVPTDGPFAEATEQLGGFYELEAPSMDVVLELVRLLPSSYTLEIRPVLSTPA
ncbi:YciI family protein [Luteipulveratus sp. YIM 133132]|uniref:YciI family protein n=1 Tax=Luteipulveratus flavus TaxID=3031728 RepID=A0ABT6C9G5_9MICO|nr:MULTISPECIES: YciI family protein [unclassified Luteipulveratus]MDE9365431.1 YciI family protein [Luteipulveratus sp. YIM 133132]MDF8263936.1 YciI family protein [Luteipulveratus sp. YIM 133296]